MTEDVLAGPLRMLVSLFALWAATSVLVSSAAARMAGAGSGGVPLLEPEAWLALAMSGAAVGGFVGISLAAPGLSGSDSILLPVATSALGMALGAALACAVAGAALLLRED